MSEAALRLHLTGVRRWRDEVRRESDGIAYLAVLNRSYLPSRPGE